MAKFPSMKSGLVDVIFRPIVVKAMPCSDVPQIGHVPAGVVKLGWSSGAEYSPETSGGDS